MVVTVILNIVRSVHQIAMKTRENDRGREDRLKFVCCQSLLYNVTMDRQSGGTTYICVTITASVCLSVCLSVVFLKYTTARCVLNKRVSKSAATATPKCFFQSVILCLLSRRSSNQP
jgi:hypothetical protein